MKIDFWQFRNLRIFLLGVYADSSSPLKLLNGHYPVIDLICSFVTSTSDFFEFGKPAMKSVNFHVESAIHPSIVLCDEVDFPPPKDIVVNMMPFIMGSYSVIADSLPDYLHEYIALILRCQDQMNPQYGKTFYLTIHEGMVKADKTQRRPGLHVDGCGSGGRAQMFRWFRWGGAEVSGGIYIASNVPETCTFYGAKVKNPEVNVSPLGDIEHLRGFLERGSEYKKFSDYEDWAKESDESDKIVALKSEANYLYWITDVTPHESIPLKKDTYRQFFRLVSSEVSGWFEDHSTPNPLGIQPDCPIIKGNKFMMFGSANNGSS